jgi:tetratricopeptide (TPR) repeat protein
MAAADRTLASIYLAAGQYAVAQPLLEESLTLTRKMGEAHPAFADSLADLARLFRLEHNAARAAPLSKKAAQIYEASGDPSLAGVLNEQGLLAVDDQKYAVARDCFRRSLAIYEKVFGPDHFVIAYVQAGLAEAYAGERNYAQAETLIRKVLAVERASLGQWHYELARSHMIAARIYEQEHRTAEADAHYREALDIYRRTVGSGHPDVAVAKKKYAKFSKSFLK